MNYSYKRLTFLCGHYGSGKTNIAVNMALDLKNSHDNVAIADLDIVNPYFRSKDSRDLFHENGIRLICSEYANSNVDIPALPQDMYSLTHDKNQMAIVDVGGDDRGALALGRLSADVLSENNYEMLMVINCYRPLTPDVESTIEIMREIETASHIPFTGIINNSNVGFDTTADDVLNTIQYAVDVSEAANLPFVATTVGERIYGELSDKIQNIIPLKLQDKIF